jgi:phosphatidylserine/phosphatidylglycerophosphate/cardiolipin synthase-like enzyme
MRTIIALLSLSLVMSGAVQAQKPDGSDTLVRPPAREFQASNASELINLIYQALPLMPMKKVLLPPEIETGFNFTVGTDQSENLIQKIVDRINSAQREIIFSTGAMNVKEIAAALVEKKLEGKIVVGIMSESPSGMKNYTAPSYFLVSNLPIFFDRSRVVSGNNFFIIDREIVVLVSTNMTETQLTESSSNILVIKDPGIVVAYYNAWIEQLRTSAVPRITQTILRMIMSKSGRPPIEAETENNDPTDPTDPWAAPQGQENPTGEQP